MSKVLILTEIYENSYDKSLLEMLTLMDDLNVDPSNIIVGALGDELESKETVLKSIPVSKVVAMKNNDTSNFNPNVLKIIAKNIVEKTNPDKIIIPKTSVGQDLATRLAYSLDQGIVNDCLNIENKDGEWLGMRPVFGGNYLAKVNISTNIEIYCVRTKIFDQQNSNSISPEIEYFENELEYKTSSHVVDRSQEQSEGLRLEDADVVVAGGRGLGGPEPFETLEEIADLLNAAVGASRAVCDAGWKDHSYQIGLTGKDISPNLYFTVGISGASQHMAGCGNSKHIVSIDKNIDANIFKDAEFGAVGDWKNILPGFLDTLKDFGKG